jgi:histidinol phosphatase-like PHP family hydrolase
MIPAERYEFHSHTLLSDGDLLLSEHVRRAEKAGVTVLAVTDHADATNIEDLLKAYRRFMELEAARYAVRVIPGVELTHVPPELIDELAGLAKAHGAAVVGVHGETIVEPVAPGTNRAAVASRHVDFLAHPGLITAAEARAAATGGVFLELSARQGHCLANGHVARAARAAGAALIVNSDAHAPYDLIDAAFAWQVARAAGLSEEEALAATRDNPLRLLSRLGMADSLS